MSDKLRAAAQAALSAMDYMLRNGEWYCAEERANALRAALAEPAIKKSLTAQRPWVGLTDDEIDTWNIVGHESLREFVRDIEAKLREKNEK